MPKENYEYSDIMDQYSKAVDHTLKSHEEKLNDLGNEFTDKILTGFCKKNKLNFYSGNGTYFFAKKSKSYRAHRGVIHLSYTDRNLDTYEGKIYKELNLDTIFAVLRLEINCNADFGYYCSDVTTFK